MGGGDLTGPFLPTHEILTSLWYSHGSKPSWYLGRHPIEMVRQPGIPEYPPMLISWNQFPPSQLLIPQSFSHLKLWTNIDQYGQLCMQLSLLWEDVFHTETRNFMTYHFWGLISRQPAIKCIPQLWVHQTQMWYKVWSNSHPMMKMIDKCVLMPTKPTAPGPEDCCMSQCWPWDMPSTWTMWLSKQPHYKQSRNR